MELGNASRNQFGKCKKDENKYTVVKEVDMNIESSHKKIVENVPEGSVVLDLGCSSGLIGRYLKKYKKCEVYGADINEDLIKIAKKDKSYEEIYNIDFDNLNDKNNPFKKNFFDVIILADIIEHLKYPDNLLIFISELLKPNGMILLSLPNIGHQNIIVNLLNGNFNYADLGLLDNTHIRFFTDKSFYDFINNINEKMQERNYKCEIIDKTISKDFESNIRDKMLMDYIKIPNMDVLQYIIKLKISNEKVVNRLEYENNYIDSIKKDKYLMTDLLLVEKEKNNQLKNDVKILTKRLLESEQTNNDLLNKYNYIENFYKGKIYKLATLTRKIIIKILPRNSLRRKVLKLFFNLIKKIMKLIFSFIKKLVPKRIRRKIIEKILTHRTLSRMIGVHPYTDYEKNYLEEDGSKELINISYQFNKKVAVHVHLYYIDLVDEFVHYLKNIPYKFDIYVSVPNRNRISYVKRKFKKILNSVNVVVKVSENKGRDFGPMFVLFGNDLKKYDYVLHIHSKKSLRTGNSQDLWRISLLDSILHSKGRVANILNLMEKKDVQLVFQECFHDVPYWAHTWLSAVPAAKNILNRINVPYADEYMNFSAGSMFWIKKESLAPFLNLNLTWNDFKNEAGAENGLEYVFERIFGYYVKKQNKKFAVWNSSKNSFVVNEYSKNLVEYKNKNAMNAFEYLNSFSIISFDIFDTLVTRKTCTPDDVFELIDKKVRNKDIILEDKFINIRKKAENEARSRLKKDVNINEIYEEFKIITKLNKKIVEEIKQLEIDTELDVIIPRKEMLEVYNRLLNNNKQIILTSDMYLPRNIIEKILEKCGYRNYFDMYISCETGYRKDNHSMWEFLFEKYKEPNIIHVGDNEESDIHSLCFYNRPSYHVMQGKKMYELFSGNTINPSKDFNNNLVKGLVVSNMYNSPFVNSSVQNLHDYGYSILGPIFHLYFSWLKEKTKAYDKLLFLSREGYYLQKIYDLYNDNKDNQYFLISRRAISVANIYNRDDIRKILNTTYEGSLMSLFYYRLGIYIKEQDTNVKIPRDNAILEKYIDRYLNEILANAEMERENYRRYIEREIPNYINQNLCVIDLGYSGTSQYELSKFLNKKIDGAYFVVSDNLKPLSLGCKVYSCFNDVIYDNSFLDNAIGIYSIFLEAILTSKDGQLLNFDENLMPNYIIEPHKEETIKKLDEVFEGIKDYILDMKELLEEDFDTFIPDKDFIIKNFEKYIENGNFTDEMIKLFKVEDFYCSDNVLEIAKR